jgi:signal transduction histidine kinase
MTRLVSRTRLWVLAPTLGGAALLAVLQVTEPEARLYAAVSPGLLARMAGLLATGIMAVITVARQRAAAATGAAVRQATAQAVQDRLRFLMRLDHELKNPHAA